LIVARHPDPVEAARLQQELRDAEVFAAELEKRRNSISPSIADAPAVNGIVGRLIRGKLAHDEVQANLILVVIIIAVIISTIWVWSHFGRSTLQTTISPEQLQRIEATMGPHLH